jgi:two-component system, NarL family, response regulator DevR
VNEGLVRVFLVDDHEVVRVGLTNTLASYDDVVVVGSASNGREALEAVPSSGADVVLLDMRLPDAQGLDVLRQLVARPHAPAVLVLTVYDDHDLVIGAARAGARGYVLKNASGDELVAAIRRIAGGGRYYADEIMAALIQGDDRDNAGLTERELEVLRLLVDGLTNRDIGRQLYLSSDTVKTHLGNAYRKLGVTSRTQAVAVVLQRGLLDSPQRPS